MYQHTSCSRHHLSVPMQRNQLTTCSLISTIGFTELVNSHRFVADSFPPSADSQSCYLLCSICSPMFSQPRASKHTFFGQRNLVLNKTSISPPYHPSTCSHGSPQTAKCNITMPQTIQNLLLGHVLPQVKASRELQTRRNP